MGIPTRFNHAADVLFETVVINKDNVTDWAIVYSGASTRFLVTDNPTSNRCVASGPMMVTILGGGQIKTTHTCILAIS